MKTVIQARLLPFTFLKKTQFLSRSEIPYRLMGHLVLGLVLCFLSAGCASSTDSTGAVADRPGAASYPGDPEPNGNAASAASAWYTGY